MFVPRTIKSACEKNILRIKILAKTYKSQNVWKQNNHKSKE